MTLKIFLHTNKIDIMKKLLLTAALAAMLPAVMSAQNSTDGGISPEMMSRISKGYTGSATDKALKNALAGTSINVLATNSEQSPVVDDHFTYRVATKGITDQNLQADAGFSRDLTS